MVFPWAILLKEKLKCCKYRTCCESLLDNLKKKKFTSRVVEFILTKTRLRFTSKHLHYVSNLPNAFSFISKPIFVKNI